ncbi:hypothetical protein KO317_02195 [Candidatus Micrarchaeota archaeon]|nr:hypothetical protein [Candidatus Micrarchaeota archaeon]
MERLKYQHYEDFQRIVEEELKEIKTLTDYNSWIKKIIDNLNDTYNPNDLMKLFVLATDTTLDVTKKYNSQKKALNLLRDWVVQHPIRDRAFTKICMEYLVKTKNITGDTVFNILDILDIMGVDLRGEHKDDEDWLRMIIFRFENLKNQKGESVKLIVERIILEAKEINTIELISTLREIVNKAELEIGLKKDLTVKSLIELTSDNSDKEELLKLMRAFPINLPKTPILPKRRRIGD